ncbi:MAG: hypothetical protein IPI73_07525 [Betaproteobacteria bacterium]|nr:hypothetical protein [Betaproteobacteria bacterium]
MTPQTRAAGVIDAVEIGDDAVMPLRRFSEQRRLQRIRRQAVDAARRSAAIATIGFPR